jgi:hypothetical protein
MKTYATSAMVDKAYYYLDKATRFDKRTELEDGDMVMRSVKPARRNN